MKYYSVITSMLALVLLPVVTSAQSSEEIGLVLAINGKSEQCPAAERQNPKNVCRKLRMAFRNQGKEPVIIINPNLEYGTGLKEAKFFFEVAGFDPKTRLYVKNTAESSVPIKPDAAKSANFRSMAPNFAGERPSENMTVTLQPGESYAFMEKFESPPQHKYRASFFPVFRNGKAVTQDLDDEKISPQYFRLVYEFSFVSIVEDPDILERMSRKWRKYGRLPVSTNGTYKVISEKINLY